jgi:NhaA family Na+:H+ antiporter
MKRPNRRHQQFVRLLSPLRDFLRTETAGAVLLAGGAVLAMAWANSPWRDSYERLWTNSGSISLAGHVLELDLRHWINDALMTVFFLVVGLEIKRELTSGHLASRRAALLPLAAALGGMITPALIYLAIAGGTAPRGWAVPMATDIALAVGVLAVVGSRLPSSLRAFLLGLAIVDDIGAIIVIAVVYSTSMSAAWLLGGLAAIGATVLARRAGIRETWPYIGLGAITWLCLYEGGVHPTLAGVIMGLLAPSVPFIRPELVDVDELVDLSTPEAARTSTDIARHSVSVVEWLQHVLHPWTSYLIVPLFALANAGIEITSQGVRAASRSAITWGIIAGLVIGKPLGIVISTRIAVRTRLADRPADAQGREMVGIGAAAGIGFTVALFITELAFTDPAQRTDAKLAIVVASVTAAVLSMLILSRGQRGVNTTGSDVMPRTNVEGV